MEATPEQFAEGQAIVQVLAAVLDRLTVANVSLARSDPGQVTKFHAMKAPGIGIQQYLERIHKYAQCSNECYILALIYIDRLIQRTNFLLTDLNVHRVVITAILLAAKFFDDAYYNNAYYAKIGGVLVSEMNGLEVDFLFRINFSLHVPPEVFDQYRSELWSQSTAVSVPSSRQLSPVAEMQTTPISQTAPLTHPKSSSFYQITPSPPAGANMVVEASVMQVPLPVSDMMGQYNQQPTQPMVAPYLVDHFQEVKYSDSGYAQVRQVHSVPLQPKPVPVDAYLRNFASVPTAPNCSFHENLQPGQPMMDPNNGMVYASNNLVSYPVQQHSAVVNSDANAYHLQQQQQGALSQMLANLSG